MSLCLAGSAYASACSDRKVLKTVVNKYFGELSFLALPPADEDVKEEETGILGRAMGRVDCSVRARLDVPRDTRIYRIYYHLTPIKEGYEVTVDRGATEAPPR